MATSAQAPMSEATRIAMRANLQSALLKSGGWFYWVAGLSLVNAVLMVSGANLRFLFGMGTTDLIAAIGKQAGGAGTGVGLFASAVVAGICVFFGFLVVQKHQAWALWLGMVLYVLDGLLLLLVGDWLSAIFHGWVIYRLIAGAKVLKALAELEQMPTAMNVPPKPIA